MPKIRFLEIRAFKIVLQLANPKNSKKKKAVIKTQASSIQERVLLILSH
jgi:hypothetical protein